MMKDVEAKIVNYRQLQYILLARGDEQKDMTAYILSEPDWTARKTKIQLAVNAQYEKMQSGYLSNPEKRNAQLKEEMWRGYLHYKPIVVSNIGATIYAELTTPGKEAYNLFLEGADNLPQSISILEKEIGNGNKENMQNLLLLSRLSLLSFERYGSAFFLYYQIIGDASLATFMEFKEAAIFLNQSYQLAIGLIHFLEIVKDPEFQAMNRNDLASLYQDAGDNEAAAAQAAIALENYQLLENKDPNQFRLNTTAVMFNLGNAYMKLERYDESLKLFMSVLQRISQDNQEDNQIKSMGFYAHKFIANIIQKTLGQKEAFPYYDTVFNAFKRSPSIASGLPQDMLFGDYLCYCEGKELNGANADQVADCYEESIKFLDNAFDAERKTLGRTIVYHKLGEILESRGENQKALEFYQRSLSELEQTETPTTRELRMELYSCIGGLLDDYSRDKEALDYFHRSIALAQAPGYEQDPNSLWQMAVGWYKIGHYYYKRENADSAFVAFNKTMEYLNNKNADTLKTAPFIANTYNMIGATLSELKKDNKQAEENYQKAVDLYTVLGAVNPDLHMMDFATAAHNLLAMQSKHPETADKEADLALIDLVMKGFMMNPDHSTEATTLMSDMNRFMLLFSGHLTAIQNAMMEVQSLSDQRQKITGNKGKSDIQSRIVARLEEAYRLADTPTMGKLKDILSQELGNLAWYAIFDRKYVLAEASARRALELNPGQTWVNTNLAHSLILQNKVVEGKAIYDQYKDVVHTDGQLMRVIFLSDIDEMEKAGIKHPAWEDVKKMLKKE
ncbi:MAG: tetratricopeptide repeat protein [Saprospiraceae bacterium]|uniref:Tetratricopeptide repeat protein n=1 Tax=Candidatus Opimibacter skivensis TaxID=2982028 RepID=A0A9D7XR19_9BACT|nr:tetratricopeptide repeat protein [Candidatus Opimibacter skivensis]